jgi:hypothetical protein
MYDLSVAAAAHSWQQAALNLTGTGVIDSVFADGCTKKPSGPHMSPARSQGIFHAKHEMLRQLQTQLPGPIVCGSDGTILPGVDAVQAEGWGVPVKGRTEFATREIPTLMRAAAAGVVYQAHGRATCGQTGEIPACCEQAPCNCTTERPDYNEPAVQTELAAFLVAMGRYSYFLCGSWEDTLSGGATTSSWLPVYDLPLGEPLGNATKHGTVWHRSFASGTNVTFDTNTERGRVYWASQP